MIQGPGIKPGSICNDIISNVDFAPMWLDFANVPIPTYMQGSSFLPMLKGTAPTQDEWQVAYHRYWMHKDDPHNSYVSFCALTHSCLTVYPSVYSLLCATFRVQCG